MTDYTQRRYGSQGEGWQGDNRSAQASYDDDPLAELARLVADERAPAQPQRRQPEFAPAPAVHAAPAVASDYRDEPHFEDERDYHAEQAAYAPPAVEAPRQDAYAEDYQDPSYADPHYTDDGHMPAAEDYADEDVEPQPRRRGLTLVMAVLGIAAVGTGGVFGYKYLSSRGLTGGTPPVIKAQSEPTKVVPEKTQTAEAPSSNKLIYDRVGSDPKTNAKVVGGAEEPLERPPSTQRDVSRVILPGGPAPTGAPTANAPANAASADAASTAPLDARKVKTFVIKPDGTVAEASTGQPVATVANTGTALPPNQPIAGQGVAEGMSMVSGKGFGIMSNDAGAGAPAATAAAESPAVPLPKARPSSVATPAAEPVRTASAAGPMPVPTAAPAGQPTRIAPASTTPQPAAAAPPAPRTAAANPATATAAAGGGFQVQLTSQKSEADARAAFTNLQRKYPQILGSYQPRITSADLGDRGTYYRVKVGPFGSRDEASTFCSSLKSAGGDCVVN